MKGESTLSGRVLPIGGLKEKALGAVSAGRTQVGRRLAPLPLPRAAHPSVIRGNGHPPLRGLSRVQVGGT
jgi:hypothetical protein